MKLPIIGFVGMSHLGLNYAVATANKKFKVICFDENITTINLLNKKKSPIFEKDLEKNIKSNFSRLKFTNDLSEIKYCDNVYISQDTRTEKNGKSDLFSTKKLITKTIKILNSKANLIILSQVPPGFCRTIKWPRKQLFYQVETLIFGQAFKRALKPERLIVGSNSKKTKINHSYIKLLKTFKCPLIKMNYESAELAKISINMFLISSVTTTNIISEVCEKIGADWTDISSSLILDKRIGKYAYLIPGLGISGGNLERDLYTLSRVQQVNGLNNRFLYEINNNSRRRKKWIFETLKKIKTKHKFRKISILGLSYKVDTHSIKNSPAINIIKKLKNFKIKAFDPVVKKINSIKNLKICKSSKEAVKGSDILIILTPWKEFKKINLIFLKKNIKNKILIDPFNLLNKNKLINKGIKHISMGVKYEI